MAEPTKAEIAAELEELRAEHDNFKVDYEDMKTKYESSPYATDANYQRELERLNKGLQTAQAELKALREKTDREQYERDQIANDRRIEEERIAKQFGTTSVEQSEHTRFRLYSQAPRGQRDIFGDPNSEVFDLGIEFDGYYGGLYLPLNTVVEIGRSVGMLTKEQADELKRDLAIKKAQVERAGDLAQELTNGIQANIDNFFTQLDSVVPDSNSDVPTKPGIDSEANSTIPTGTETGTETRSIAERLAALKSN